MTRPVLTALYFSTFAGMGALGAFADGKSLVFAMIGFILGVTQMLCVALRD